jgi:glycosyltransferase involved in cell wall biosynthesis
MLSDNRNKQPILLIAFKYPPYAGVGGFRWSKLSKYLAKMGHIVHVVTVHWEMNGPNTLMDDVNHPNIIIHRISSGYSHNFKYRAYPKTKFGNLKRIFRYMALKAVDSIWYEDEAHHWGRYLLPYCKKLIKDENITNVIATGHPFMANYWAARLKKDVPKIHLIQDFRDPWIQSPTYRQSKNKRQTEKAEKFMSFSLEYADLCVCVTNGLIDEYKKYYDKTKYALITNGYDDEMLQNIVSSRFQLNKKSGEIYISHIGSVTNGRDRMLNVLFDALVDHDDCVFCFAGFVPERSLKLYKKLLEEQRIIDFGFLSPEDALSLVQQSDIALHLNADIVPYLVSTKVYEYAALGRPILSINGGGEIDTLLSENQWGISINYRDPNFADKVLRYIRELKPNDNPHNLKKYSYLSIADQYSQLISEK